MSMPDAVVVAMKRPLEDPEGQQPVKKRRSLSKAGLTEEHQLELFLGKIRRQIQEKFGIDAVQMCHEDRNVTISCWQCGKQIKIATGHIHLRSMNSHLERCKGSAAMMPKPGEEEQKKSQRRSSKKALSEENLGILFLENARRQLKEKFKVDNVTMVHKGRNVCISCWQCGKAVKIAGGRLNLSNLKAHLDRCKPCKKPKRVLPAQPAAVNQFLCAGLTSDEIRNYCSNAMRMFGGCQRREEILKKLFNIRSFKNLTEEQLEEFQKYEFSTRKWNIVGTTVFSVECTKVSAIGKTCHECLSLYRNKNFVNTLCKYRARAQKLADGVINENYVKYIPRMYVQHPGAKLAQSFENQRFKTII
ncbi:hypothetical protein LEN26_020290 [Aphanomyces euteiches]|nr:hypothetical protein LEN26_020290 [Aphanomyces euteiches]KAH9123245.1 hypothetical protein AeMF1_005722 [Aphanomyces euteiches]KAH9183861.1 hypothetical protein AeNC1_014165 [Aphanomyces euteiches]